MIRRILKTGERTYVETVRAAKKTYEYIVGRDARATIVFFVKDTSSILNLRVRLHKPGASAKIVGVVLGAGKDTVTLHTMQLHEAPDTTSDLLVKGVLDDEATLLYDGGIYVAPKAQKTNAYQRNENLLLAQTAHAKSKPALEILANDVRCTHGATVGTLSKDQLWYLASRGIGKSRGSALIVSGFVRSAFVGITDTIPSKLLKGFAWTDL
jgi:Fe-S cluster assembly protein SufD